MNEDFGLDYPKIYFKESHTENPKYRVLSSIGCIKPSITEDNNLDFLKKFSGEVEMKINFEDKSMDKFKKVKSKRLKKKYWKKTFFYQLTQEKRW